RVETHRHLAGTHLRELVDDLRLLDGSAPDDDPRHAGGEALRRVVHGANAAAALHAYVDRDTDLLDRAEVHRATAARRVEVDDMDPLDAGVGVRAGDRDRIIAVHRLLFVVALTELHDPAAAEIDRRVEDHVRTTAHASTKLRSSARPVA